MEAVTRFGKNKSYGLKQTSEEDPHDKLGLVCSCFKRTGEVERTTIFHLCNFRWTKKIACVFSP